MSNPYYTASGTPGGATFGSSAAIRAEFAAIAAGFDKLPTLAGNALKLMRVNAGETAFEADPNTYQTAAATTVQILAAVASYLPLIGGSLSGPLTLNVPGTVFNAGVTLDSGATTNNDLSPAVVFGAANHNAAIYSTRLTSFGGRLVLATQPTGGGAPISRLVVDEAGNVAIGGASAGNILDLYKSLNGTAGVVITNATSGTSAASGYVATSDTGHLAQFLQTSSAYSALAVAGVNTALLHGNGIGGMALVAANGTMRFASRGSVETMRLGDGAANDLKLYDGCFSTTVTTASVSGLAFTPSDYFTTDTDKRIGNYALQWKQFSDALAGPSVALSGYGGQRFYTTGVERMTIDASGNVGIGTLRNAIDATLALRADSGDGPSLSLTNRVVNGSTHRFGTINFSAYRDVANPSYVASIWAEGTSVAGNLGDLVFGTAVNGSGAAPTVRMRITSAGVVAIGGAVTAASFAGAHSGSFSGTTGAFSSSLNVVVPGSLTVNNLRVMTDMGSDIATVPVGGLICGERVGAGSAVAVGGTLLADGTNYIRNSGMDGVQTNVQYGTWRAMGAVSGNFGLWQRLI